MPSSSFTPRSFFSYIACTMTRVATPRRRPPLRPGEERRPQSQRTTFIETRLTVEGADHRSRTSSDFDGTKWAAQELKGVDLIPARSAFGAARLEPVHSDSQEDVAISFADFYAVITIRWRGR